MSVRSIPTITNPATNAGRRNVVCATHTNGRDRLQKNQMNNWLPRVGVAYQLSPKTAVEWRLWHVHLPMERR